MDNKYLFEKAIVVGSGQLAFHCARILAQYEMPVEVLELKVTDSTTLEKMCAGEEIAYATVDKRTMAERLMQETATVLVVSAANTYLFPAQFLAKENVTVINWHNALLPRHKGRNAESWTIYEGDKETGVTWHYALPAVDAGGVIAQSVISLDEPYTALQLYKKQYETGLEMFKAFAIELITEGIEGRMQQEAEEEQLHYAKDVPNEGFLDLDWDIGQMKRFLRAMDYGSLLLMGRMKVRYEERNYSFYRYRIKEEAAKTADGKMIYPDGKNLVIEASGCKIILRELQEERE